jgi:hypothetical protein
MSAGLTRKISMPKKRHSPEGDRHQAAARVAVMTSQGRTVGEAIRSIGVAEVTDHRWRNEFGGLKRDQVRRLKELELEKSRLRKAVSDLTFDKLILTEALLRK